MRYTAAVGEQLAGEALAREVHEWIRRVTVPTIAHPVKVTLICTEKRQPVFYGCEWTELREVAAGCKAYADGYRTYEHRAIYLVGDPPREVTAQTGNGFQAGSKYFWRREGYPHTDWYHLGHCIVQKNNPEWMERYGTYHPFGSSFQLAPWTSGYSPNPPIFVSPDFHYNEKATRKQFRVEKFGPAKPTFVPASIPSGSE